MKTYQSISIVECHDPLVEIPAQSFAVTTPHPYAVLGAPYGDASAWMLRRRVLEALLQVQQALNAQQPGWRLKLFDAYRPVPVQTFMVWRAFCLQAERAGESLTAYRDLHTLQQKDPALYARLADKVFVFWSVPSDDPRTPPPHSTGAAIDLTLQDAAGNEIAMGCPIDETTERAYPDHYANAASPAQRECHKNRVLLNTLMTSAGFVRHSHEWWHFSFGDQLWAWTCGESVAVYGRADHA